MSDEDIRHLERLVAGGDVQAEQRLYLARWRTRQCHLHPDESLFQCSICLAPTQRDFPPRRRYAHNITIDLLLRDLGPDATIYDIAAWIADRSGPYSAYPEWTIFSTFNPIDARICRRPLPWIDYTGEQIHARNSLDTIDSSADVYNSGVFSQVNQLDDWHQLSRLVESNDPHAHAAPRPTAAQALAYFLTRIEETLGSVEWHSLEAVHQLEPVSRSFEIFARLDPAEEPVPVGTVQYNIETMEFFGISVHFQI